MDYNPQDEPMPPYQRKTGSSEYHTRDDAHNQSMDRAREARRGQRVRATSRVDPLTRRIIAWDGEGMKLSGPKNPQHYVLFGCSAEPANPLVIKHSKDDLDFARLVNYACDLARKHPNAFHIGYYFRYDMNMIIKSLSSFHKLRLYEHNSTQTTIDGTTYRVKWIPGKRIWLTRINLEGKTTIRIDDIASFFAQSFVKAYEGMFQDSLGDEWQIVREGKAARSDMLWHDMANVRRYWEAEIVALERLADRFRDIMYTAGFELTDWYGPGALANLIRKTHGLAVHEWGGKQEHLPAAVHDASKRAYFGGHVEQYQVGRIQGPVYALDLNGAYPAALADFPSMREGGHWKHRDGGPSSKKPPQQLSVWRVRYSADTFPGVLPQPLPHRDTRKEITYPTICEGWYWEPEAWAAMMTTQAHIVEGWEWFPADVTERPWKILEDMYEKRKALRAVGDPCERAFKLGPNSMYGKMAQRAGWNEKEKLPPRAHTLPIAGYITASCRSDITDAMRRLMRQDIGGIVAVETDGIFTTVNPADAGIGTGTKLGDWSLEVYDEMLYVQNGIYLARQGEEWKIRTRGMHADGITHQLIRNYLRTLRPNEEWEGCVVPQGERFIGLGSALARSRVKNGTGPPNPFKLAALHCRWINDRKEIRPGARGKRIHIPKLCPACRDGYDAASAAHTLIVRSSPLTMSQPYGLPWETGEDGLDKYRTLDVVAMDEIPPDQT